MENLPSSSTPCQGGRPDFPGHDNPSTDLRSPTIPAIHYYICHCFTFLVSSVVCIFNCFHHPSEVDDFNPVDRSTEETSASACSPMPCEDNQNATACASLYQVFINHRGPDVKKTLASIIHYFLHNKGLQVFLDKDEFQPGQPLKSTIREAIWASSVHIAIFSKRYAESSWCLNELCQMLQTGAPIIPVFFDVRPQDLRWIEKGEYASAFAEHERKGRFDSQTISAWKSALQEVSHLSGFDLQEKYNGDWVLLLKSLEDAVFQNLKPVPLEVATDPVGLDESIRDFESFMESEQQNENEKVKIVGILGLGGSGKTTLATEIFNRRRPFFERSSFLFNLRDASNRNALPGLQSKLLQDLLHIKNCKIDSVFEGKAIIREWLQSLSSRVLIVLDDIDHPSQVEALLVKDVLSPGSLIIITSGDREALVLLEASIYKMKALSPKHAQDLFCKHAFQQPYQIVGFENLVENFCEKCGRLPLFLKVMGAHLRVNASNDREVWENELNYIPRDILNILDVTYRALRNEEKQIFLDIACFFLGEDKTLAIKVWDKCEGRGLRRLNILVNKCLVKFDDENRLKMHDQVRDFGRDIANKESPYRLWNEDQASNFSQQPEATKEFRGIMAATVNFRYDCESSYKWPLKGIELSALKFLVINGDCFDKQIGGKLKNLVWFRWSECPHTNISPWLISMKSLTVLELLGGEIEMCRLGSEQVYLRQLKIVRTNLSIISFPQNVCPRLEHLDLRWNRRLIKVEHLPEGLVELNLEGCMKLEELQGLEHLPLLQHLDISNCSELCELQKLQHLSSLEIFNAFYCVKLRYIQGIEHLQQLRHLNISRCFKLRELPKLQHLSSLETLDLSCCAKLQHIQGLQQLPQLRNLDISECSELCELPKLQHLPSLETLEVSYCAKLQHIQGLEQLPQLRNLNISECSELLELPKLQHLPSLETLKVSSCAKLQHIQGLEQLPQLRNLDISECPELRELPELQHLPSLETLKVCWCANLQHIHGLEQLPQLLNMNIFGCSELRKLPKLQHLPSLEMLEVSCCANLQHIQGLEQLAHLRNLNIFGCSELRELPKLQHLPSLETLRVSCCANLQHMQGLDQLPQLRNMNISRCSELHELPKLQHLPSLATLKVSCCDNLQHIQGLEQLPQLRNLNIFECSALRELLKLQHLPSLETLEVSCGGNLQHIQGLEQLPQLRNLNISRCSELQEFPNLAHVISLEEVEADGCRKLHGIQCLDQQEKLKSLTLSSGDSTAIWNSIEHMKKLPRRICLGARAQVNSLDIADPHVIDLNIHPIRHRNHRTWELRARAEEENPSTSFMLCFCFVAQIAQFRPRGFPRFLKVTMMDDKNDRIVDWITRV